MGQLTMIICRCEEVSVDQLEQAYHSGCITTRQLKMKTRVAMGACQGRICRHLVDSWMQLHNPTAGRDETLLSYRMPIRQVTFGQLAKDDD
ncbi:(2Fe-2S)-binding protein [Paenibacillus agricola]|uniref:(2Fe-2S)-binding protein n=1 Tax=Paenibacillus agricola TaxID=2716264 RepID=A0ABX0JA90_9BACL|nr:(2Fe-2S)-binding protein [Paenibacillus agricola]NHN32676.1 (2Fe-2S)-binding protein [Paenibacillus agricola]